MGTVQMKKIMITIPSNLLNEVETIAKEKKYNRSRIIREFLRSHIDELKRRELFKQLKDGYIVNSQRDQEISEDFICSDNELEEKLLKQEES
jgi:CopG family transcriptional regulator / antitoxin EndoAI